MEGEDKKSAQTILLHCGYGVKILSKENARLKQLLAERDQEVDALKELLAKKLDPCRTARRHGVLGETRPPVASRLWPKYPDKSRLTRR